MSSKKKESTNKPDTAPQNGSGEKKLRRNRKSVEGLIYSICYIWWLEMKNTIKDEGVLIFFLLVPLGYPLLYSWIYNNEVVRDVPVAVVDLSQTPHLTQVRPNVRRFARRTCRTLLQQSVRGERTRHRTRG